MTYFANTASNSGFQHTVASLPTLAVQAMAVFKQRRALAELDHTQLSDIGLTTKQAQTEAKRPFWDFH